MDSTRYRSECIVGSEVSVSDCGRWVYTRIEGPITQRSALEFIAEAAQEADARRLNAFLFDVRRASNSKSVFEDYEIANRHLRKLGFSVASRVVLLVNPGDKTHDFFELTASNAGHLWKVFDEEETAAAWLERQRTGPAPSNMGDSEGSGAAQASVMRGDE
jgi:hypothetical protein